MDDHAKATPDGTNVIGTTKEISQYGNVIVAVGNPETSMNLLRMLEGYLIENCESPLSLFLYFNSVQIGKGCIVEPMAVIYTGCVLSNGCIVSAGAVLNHCSMLCDGVHINCTATVDGYALVPTGTKVCSDEVFKKDTVKLSQLFSNRTKQTEIPQASRVKAPQSGPILIDGKEYCFEDGM